jgi:pSer/pThr/pTyr-binding forkhead associated (FHA) protein
VPAAPAVKVPEAIAPEPVIAADAPAAPTGGSAARAEWEAGIRPVPISLPVPETVLPEPVAPAGDDDDFDATIVVSRKRGVRRVLVLDDGRTFALSATSIVIGRNPDGDPGEQRLSIPDKTRTLSKTHARLVVQGDEWRLTDLHSTNGVVVVADDGHETLLDAGESVTGAGRFILGEVGMHVDTEPDS